MQQLKNEDKLSGESIDIDALLRDDDAFENLFFPSTKDNNPIDLDEIIDFNELQAILDEGKENEEMHFDGGGSGGSSHGSSTADHINNDEQMKAKTKINDKKQVIKKCKARKRVQKGTPEAYEMEELRKIKNREASARAYEKNKAYVKGLEFEVLKYRKKNAYLKRLLLFEESSISLDMPRKQLRRRSSGLL